MTQEELLRRLQEIRNDLETVYQNGNSRDLQLPHGRLVELEREIARAYTFEIEIPIQ